MRSTPASTAWRCDCSQSRRRRRYRCTSTAADDVHARVSHESRDKRPADEQTPVVPVQPPTRTVASFCAAYLGNHASALHQRPTTTEKLEGTSGGGEYRSPSRFLFRPHPVSRLLLHRRFAHSLSCSFFYPPLTFSWEVYGRFLQCPAKNVSLVQKLERIKDSKDSDLQSWRGRASRGSIAWLRHAWRCGCSGPPRHAAAA